MDDRHGTGSGRVIDTMFRERAGQMHACLARALGLEHLDLIEDVVQDAFVEALRRWPYQGTPDNPGGWLLAVARNRALDALRRRGRLQRLEGEVTAAFDRLQRLDAPSPGFADEVRDDQLRMMLACCHPEIPRDSQVALTLRTVSGLSVNEIARALLSSSSAVGQRIVRAKRLLRDREVAMEIPAPGDLGDRLVPLMEAIYLLFNEGYSAHEGELLVRHDLCFEAVRLGRIVAAHPLAGTPTAHALQALMLLHAARLAGRAGRHGHLLPLSEQNRDSWNREMIAEGLDELRVAGTGDTLSDYHLQAEIAAHHVSARDYDSTDWPAILACYDALYRRNPSPVVAVNRAVALAEVHGAAAGLTLLADVAQEATLDDYLPYHAARADLNRRLRHVAAATHAYERALALARSTPVRSFLERRLWEVRRVQRRT